MHKYIQKYFILGPLCFSLLGGALLLSETAAQADPDSDSVMTLMAEKSDNNGRFGRDHDNGRHRGDEFKDRDDDRRNDKRGYDKDKRNNKDGRKHDDRYDRRDRDRDGDRDRYHRNDRNDRNDRDQRGDRYDRDWRDRNHNNRGDSKFGLENEHRGFDIDRRSPL